MFVGDVYGKAEEAADFHLSVFKNSKRGTIAACSDLTLSS
jgi:predicted 3-demethylubiquinone-9 3-methyltransferase (glyoxalase superfamily)